MKKNYLVFSAATVLIALLFFFTSQTTSSSQNLLTQKQKDVYAKVQENLNEYGYFKEIPLEFRNDADKAVLEKNTGNSELAEDNRLTDDSMLKENTTENEKEDEKEVGVPGPDGGEPSIADNTIAAQPSTLSTMVAKAEAPVNKVAAATPVSYTQNTAPAAPVDSLLREGVQSEAVRVLQVKLRELGYLNSQPTGYFGSLTTAAVKWLQRDNGLSADGVAGAGTLQCVERLLNQPKKEPSRSEPGENVLIPWFGNAQNIFSIGKTATIYDIATGLSFKVKRTYGYNHADCETLTSSDTQIMKNIYGGQFSWSRRAVMVLVDGKRIAASMAGMPHAGLDNINEGVYVDSRSGGYGYGYNLDAVKGNNMSGHFDIHFYGSKTHGSNSVDSAHQSMVQQAAAWAKSN